MTPPDPLTSRLTLERLEAARKAVYAFRDFAREHGMDFRRRDPLVLDICDVLDAAAPLVSPPGEPELSLSEEWSRMADELDTVLPDTAGPDLNKLRRIARAIRALVRTQKPVEAPPSAPPPAETE